MSAANPDPDLAIGIRDLDYRYPGSTEPALEAIDLEVARGECFGLLGPNGAGKTTLLSILTGILTPRHGEVRIAGRPLSGARELKRQCALVPQDFAFYPGLTGRENLRFFAGLSGLDAEQRRRNTEQAVAICQLEEVLHKRAETYSGGLKRRLNLAIGLLNRPEILYLDEPTVGIDAQSRQFILDAIRRLRGEGMTVVYTSHYMEEVQAICDSVAIIDHGRMVLQNSLAALLAEQQQLLDVTLREAPAEAQLQALSALGRVEVRGKRVKVDLASADISLDRILAEFRAAQLTPRQIQYGINRLEDVYLSITKHELRD